MQWRVRLDEIPVYEARLYLIFGSRVERRAVLAKSNELRADYEQQLAGLVRDFGLESSSAAYVDIDSGVVPDELWNGAKRAFEAFIATLGQSFAIESVTLDPREPRADQSKQRSERRAPRVALGTKAADQLACQLMRLERKQDLTAICPGLNAALLRNPQALAQAFASVIARGNVAMARLVDDMDANPTDRRFKTRVGDGIRFGLISIYEALGDGQKTRQAARRFLALVESFDPKLTRAYSKQIAFAKSRLEDAPRQSKKR